MATFIVTSKKGKPCDGCGGKTTGACLREKCKRFDRKQTRERSNQGQCIMCGSSDSMSFDDTTFDCGFVSQKASCGACEIEYWDVYHLEFIDSAGKSGDIESVDIDEPKPIEIDALKELKVAREWLGSGDRADDKLDQEVWKRLDKIIKRIEARI